MRHTEIDSRCTTPGSPCEGSGGSVHSVIQLETLREMPVAEIWANSTGHRDSSTKRSCDGRAQAVLAAWPNQWELQSS